MGGHSNHGFVREQSAELPERWGGPILQGYLFVKEKYHVLRRRPRSTKRMSTVVVAPGLRDPMMTLVRIEWHFH